MLRRNRPHLDERPHDRSLRFADLELDETTHDVRRAGQLISLSLAEFTLPRYLMLNAEKVLSKAQILDQVWRYDFAGDVRIMESHISMLRRKVDGFDPPLIHTLRGVGTACDCLAREAAIAADQAGCRGPRAVGGGAARHRRRHPLPVALLPGRAQ